MTERREWTSGWVGVGQSGWLSSNDPRGVEWWVYGGMGGYKGVERQEADNTLWESEPKQSESFLGFSMS